MENNLITKYMNDACDIKEIQAVSLWAHKSLKKELLFIPNDTILTNFVYMVAGNLAVRREIRNRYKQTISIVYDAPYPFGNAFFIEIAYFNPTCCIFFTVRFIYRFS